LGVLVGVSWSSSEEEEEEEGGSFLAAKAASSSSGGRYLLYRWVKYIYEGGGREDIDLQEDFVFEKEWGGESIQIDSLEFIFQEHIPEFFL
jgi:hypothetical protein